MDKILLVEDDSAISPTGGTGCQREYHAGCFDHQSGEPPRWATIQGRQTLPKRCGWRMQSDNPQWPKSFG